MLVEAIRALYRMRDGQIGYEFSNARKFGETGGFVVGHGERVRDASIMCPWVNVWAETGSGRK